ncbi:hypothetical protein RhiirA1_542787 [Rhizophagus irregularis]|uniref:Uncharacterized protein n=1 Tax=Rhizophagus irregularis TaxID=588596 RepID=A0A2N0QUH9_9GLOM|nr:hypothetical protein RhiirA1_542787 [Rhizophagus irregularis]
MIALIFLIIVIEDFNNPSQNYASTSKANSILKGMSKRLSKVFNKLQIKSNNGNQINYGKEIVEQQQIKQYNLNINDEDETYDDKNFHLEEDDVFEIPDGKAITSIDYDIYDDIHKRHEFKKQTILADNSLTNDEKLMQ